MTKALTSNNEDMEHTTRVQDCTLEELSQEYSQADFEEAWEEYYLAVVVPEMKKRAKLRKITKTYGRTIANLMAQIY